MNGLDIKMAAPNAEVCACLVNIKFNLTMDG